LLRRQLAGFGFLRKPAKARQVDEDGEATMVGAYLVLEEPVEH